MEIETDNPRDAAEKVVAEMIRQGYSVDPSIVDDLAEELERKISSAVQQCQVANLIVDRVNDTLEAPLQKIDRQVRRISRRALQIADHG